MAALIDIYSGILKYNDKKMAFVLDKNGEPWFHATAVSHMLKYSDVRQPIRLHLSKLNKQPLANIVSNKTIMKLQEKYPNIQHATIFTNESGLYSLILSSKKKNAKEFQKWITEEVLPSIRKHGNYSINKNLSDKLEKINKKLLEVTKENKILLHNQKKQTFQSGGAFYAVQYIGSKLKLDNLIKIGKTTNMKGRIATYNTSMPNKFVILHVIYCDNPSVLENCLKELLKKYVYVKNKEYYKCPKTKIIEYMNRCNNFFNKNISRDKKIRDNSFDTTFSEKDDICKVTFEKTGIDKYDV